MREGMDKKWRCAICGGSLSDARIFYHPDGAEARVHPYPYKAAGRIFMCEFTAKYASRLREGDGA